MTQESWIYDQLQPEEQLYHRRTKKEPSALALKMKDADKYPDRETVSEAEQVRQEDEYLAKCGVI